VHRFGQLLEHVQGAEIEDPVHGVQSQRIDMVLGDPVQRVVDDEPADLVAARAVVVHRAPPRGAVSLGEVGTEGVEVIPLRTDVVVHDVEHHREPLGVCCVHESLEPIRSAVRALDRVQVDAVVAPVAPPRELGHRHDLDRRHAELAEPGQIGDRRVERTLVGEGAYVQLVDDVVRLRDPTPLAVGPPKGRGVDDAGRAVHPLRLEAAHRVGQIPGAVLGGDDVPVIRSRADIRDDALVDPALIELG
jgi:hypothetical protein